MISLSTVVLVAVFCLCFEAFFSGSEIAMVSASRSLIKKKAAAGDSRARLVEKYLEHPQIFLATTLMGTNLATVTFSVTVALSVIGHTGEAFAVLVVVPINLIFGEVFPKSVFQQHADFLVTKIVYPLRLASFVLRPGVLVMSAFATLMTRVFDVERERAFITRDELALLIESEAGEGSEITVHEREMIASQSNLPHTDHPH